MRIAAVELRLVVLRLVEPLGTSRGRHDERPVVIVRVLPEEGPEGWGECGALAAPTYTAEYASAAAEVLAGELIPRLFAGGPLESDEPVPEALRRLDAVRGHPMAKAALEMALLDAWLRAEGRSLAAFLGVTRPRVAGGATIGTGTPEEVVAATARAAEAGYTRVKCKITPGRDLAGLVAVRAAFPELVLAADANGAYRLDDREHRAVLHRLDELALVALEQPLPADDLVGHAALVSELATPILLDESVQDEGDLAAAIALGALDGLSVKPGRLGGILAAKRAHDRCREEGLHLAIGGLFETGLARAAHLAVAAMAGFDLPGDLGASDRYFSPDLTAAHLLVDGELAVPGTAGLGATPERAVLAKRTARVGWARPGEPLSWTATS